MHFSVSPTLTFFYLLYQSKKRTGNAFFLERVDLSVQLCLLSDKRCCGIRARVRPRKKLKISRYFFCNHTRKKQKCIRDNLADSQWELKSYTGVGRPHFHLIPLSVCVQSTYSQVTAHMCFHQLGGLYKTMNFCIPYKILAVLQLNFPHAIIAANIMCFSIYERLHFLYLFINHNAFYLQYLVEFVHLYVMVGHKELIL